MNEEPVLTHQDKTPAAPAAPAVRARRIGGGKDIGLSLLGSLRRPSVIIALLALLLLAWQWVETRSRLRNMQRELATRLASSDSSLKENRGVVKQNQETLTALQAKIAVLDSKLAESQSQQGALEAMYQELTRNRDERLLSEVERALNTAAQQLHLAGNVEAALIALQDVDAHLASSGRVQFLPLRKVISRDIDRLKALPMADLQGIALRLESVTSAVDTLPLAFEAKPRVEPVKPAPQPMTTTGYWLSLAENLWSEFWGELKGLIRIERLDGADPALISPSQTFFLRENLKLRLVNARLGLLQHDGRSFRDDVVQAETWLNRYFDKRAKPVQNAIATLNQLASVDVAPELPSLSESMTVLRTFKVARDRDSLSLPAARLKTPMPPATATPATGAQ